MFGYFLFFGINGIDVAAMKIPTTMTTMTT